jgi:hypothetical protein
MKKVFLMLIVLMLGAELHSQPWVNVLSIPQKSDTVYQFSLLGKNLDADLANIRLAFGTPVSESPGEVIWEKIDIPDIGTGLKIRMVDGLLTTNKHSGKCVPFKETKNKNKSKNCLLKCMKENQARSLNFTISCNDLNAVNTVSKARITIAYLEKIIGHKCWPDVKDIPIQN